MHNSIYLTLAILLTCCSLVSAADASESGDELVTPVVEQGFATLDDDRDGAVSLLEMIKAVRPLGFGAQEAAAASPRGRGRGGNRGGGASGGEGESRGAGNRGGRGGFDPADRFKSFDQDGDGVLQGAEINARLTGSKYAEDGKVTLDEFQAAFEEMRSQMAAGGGHNHGNGHSHGGEGGRGGRGGSPTATTSEDAALLVSFDIDRDRKITLTEIRTALKNEAERLMELRMGADKDGDGKISIFEVAGSLEAEEGTQLDEEGLDRRSRMTFAREDADQDGFVSAAEIRAQVDAQLRNRATALGYCLLAAKVDADGDKQVSAVEAGKLQDKELIELLRITEDQPLDLASFYATTLRRLSRRR
ncbi:EF-hand domain-containing protein [Blastopirellula retiformator]|uniref:EF hand n=1 Tax=Blastopirellula retiformator TaxID=2527970 RepID=A0A5C5V0C7_9BACT|nr:hypothetical protein [Blastopirellula retiformator]TWT31509.1 EF hand [Blastopirellula retiformator]